MPYKDPVEQRRYYKRYDALRSGKRLTQVKDYHLQRTFGISLAEYNLMVERQNGMCALCGRHVTELNQSLAVDHCHETERIRGLLCMKCNTALGVLGDTEESIKRVLEYVQGDINAGI